MNDIKVFISSRESTCDECRVQLGRHAWITLYGDDKAVTLAVTAHIRHAETNYDDLLISGYERLEAREMVKSKIIEVLEKWGND